MSKEQRTDVETKLKLGVKISVLQKHVENLTGKLVRTKDLHNVRQSMQRLATGGKNENELLIDKLDEIGKATFYSMIYKFKFDNVSLKK